VLQRLIGGHWYTANQLRNPKQRMMPAARGHYGVDTLCSQGKTRRLDFSGQGPQRRILFLLDFQDAVIVVDTRTVDETSVCRVNWLHSRPQSKKPRICFCL
jgi:hypothetical protein